MKHLLVYAAAICMGVAGLQAQTSTTTTTTYTTSSGVIHEYTPGSTFIVKETSGPVTYSYGDKVVYATRSGTVLTPAQVQARIRVGVPVSVQYVPQGETRVIQRVVLDEDAIEELKED